MLNLMEINKNTNIPLRTLRECVRQGKLKAHKVGRSYFVHEEDLKDFIERKFCLIGKIEKWITIPRKCIGKLERAALMMEKGDSISFSNLYNAGNFASVLKHNGKKSAVRKVGESEWRVWYIGNKDKILVKSYYKRRQNKMK